MESTSSISVTSYNILLDIWSDDLPSIHQWPSRMPRVAGAIEQLDPDILCVQEMSASQKADLLTALAGVYICYAKIYENNPSNGIFFKKDRFTPLDSAIIPTGENNHISYLKLRDEKTSSTLAVLNTHLNYPSPELRGAQAAVIHFIAKAILIDDPNAHLVVTGDMNTFPNRSDLALPFYDGDVVEAIIKGDILVDAREVSKEPPLGPASSFTNANKEDPTPFLGTGVDGVTLDHIFVTKNIKVLSSQISPIRVDGQFPSDHMPITALIDIA